MYLYTNIQTHRKSICKWTIWNNLLKISKLKLKKQITKFIRFLKDINKEIGHRSPKYEIKVFHK